ncbi:hypothetical protein [Acinetobacter nectaris]|uniref:hypothetical protein n=1 Tax=Acinetobacter nectaris TaxID=1219382 RepID=UPI001F16E07F|nr:hypothetical protein [Acinetobacter nectaris]MCF9035354.1 hypothetical protein [Acinetobacter nectaris]
MISKEFSLSESDIYFYKKTGFLKLKNFFSKETIEYMTKLTNSEVSKPEGNYGSGFSKYKYDIGNDDKFILSMMQDKKFSSAIQSLTQKKVFFTQGLGFELEKNKSSGFPWHVGTQSFGFQQIDDYGFTIWTPLCKIDSKNQRGGMAYIPTDVLSGRFIYQHINMLPKFMKSKIESDKEYKFEDFSNLKNSLLNSKEMSELLDFYAIEDDFELGDTFIFDKYVLHRSVKLEDGELDSRLAYALRFSSVDATYDKQRVLNLDYPRKLFNYDVSSEFNDAVCSLDQENIFNSNYFDKDREQRVVFSFEPKPTEELEPSTI